MANGDKSGETLEFNTPKMRLVTNLLMEYCGFSFLIAFWVDLSLIFAMRISFKFSVSRAY